MNRRNFLQALGALGVTTPLSAQAFLNLDWLNDNPKEFWLSASGHRSDQYAASWVSKQAGHVTAKQVLTGFRGHGLAQNPKQPEQIIMTGRSPATQSIVLDLVTGNTVHTMPSLPNHHMQGHACFSHDGQFLFSTEAHKVTGQGRISVRDTQTFSVVNHFDSHGIGPHELCLMPDQKTLVIANGGLHKSFNGNRKVLNLQTMDSSLVYINCETGQLVSQHRLEEKSASIRHIDVNTDGTVAAAIQVQRAVSGHSHSIPLAAIHKPNSLNLILLNAEDKVIEKLNDYLGSVRIHSELNIAAFTSPKGNLALFWNMKTEELIGLHAFHNVCGLTLDSENKHFILSNSAGKIRQINALTLKEDRDRRMSFPNLHWDNHMFTAQIRSS
jgi:hypothetical protein